MLCRYSGLFGEPGVGVHAPRVGGLAAVDVAGTVVLMTAVLARCRPGVGVAVLLVLAMIVAVVFIHEAFCVNTRFNAWVFRRPWGVAVDRKK